MSRYAVGLGSNQGDRLAHLENACREIAELGSDWTASGLYETEPVGGPEQGPFLNAVVVVETPLEPLELLDALQTIELAHGRERLVRWGPRTLDLDIVATDRGSFEDDRLTIPHPRSVTRAFVLCPLVDVWPDAPVADGVTARSALAEVDVDGVNLVRRQWIGDNPPDPSP